MRLLLYLCYIDEYIDVMQGLLEHIDGIQSITCCSSSTAKKKTWREMKPLPDFVAKQNILNFITTLMRMQIQI